MSEYLIRTLLNDIDIDPPQKLSIKYPSMMVNAQIEGKFEGRDSSSVKTVKYRYTGNLYRYTGNLGPVLGWSLLLTGVFNSSTINCLVQVSCHIKVESKVDGKLRAK